MRARLEKDDRGYLLRLFGGRHWHEFAYARAGFGGLRLEVEFPSDWHESKAGWVRVGVGLCSFAFQFPWWWLSRDDGQCSGHTYGFVFFDDGLHIHWGKSHGTRDDPFTIIKMPWAWRHREHKILTEPENFSYTYRLRSGEVQQRTAAVNVESRMWTRPWLPRKRLSRSINVKFDGEVGERSGSWKGGTIGCGYEMLPNESAWMALRRMEREREF